MQYLNAEIVLEHEKMIKSERLKVLKEKMQALNQNVDDTYRF